MGWCESRTAASQAKDFRLDGQTKILDSKCLFRYYADSAGKHGGKWRTKDKKTHKRREAIQNESLAWRQLAFGSVLGSR